MDKNWIATKIKDFLAMTIIAKFYSFAVTASVSVAVPLLFSNLAHLALTSKYIKSINQPFCRLESLGRCLHGVQSRPSRVVRLEH